jgi:hypothetical protein
MPSRPRRASRLALSSNTTDSSSYGNRPRPSEESRW